MVLGPTERIERIADGALVCELTVISLVGRPISHSLIPLYDGEKLYPKPEHPVLQEAHAHPNRVEVHECGS